VDICENSFTNYKGKLETEESFFRNLFRKKLSAKDLIPKQVEKDTLSVEL